MVGPTREEAIDRRRSQIDAIHRELLKLLNERALLAFDIGRRKRDVGIRLRDPKRESEILARVRQRNAGPLSGLAIERLFRAVIAECRRTASRQSRETHTPSGGRKAMRRALSLGSRQAGA